MISGGRIYEKILVLCKTKKWTIIYSLNSKKIQPVALENGARVIITDDENVLNLEHIESIDMVRLRASLWGAFFIISTFMETFPS